MKISSACLILGALLGQSAWAEQPKDSGAVAAKCVSVAGILLNKEANHGWKPVKVGDALHSGALVIGLPRSELISPSGALQVRMLADIGNRGPFPVLEAGLTLHDAAGVDLDLTPGRGLIVFENLRKNGEAKVRLRIRDEVWVLSLQTPGTKVGLEIFGRHAPGLVKVIDSSTDNPTADLLILVLAGQAFLDTGNEGMGMHAPPGLARLHWDSVLRKPTFQRLDKLPENVVKPLDGQEEGIFKEMASAAASLAKSDVGKALDELAKSNNKNERFTGMTLAGALDDLSRVFSVLMNSKQVEDRDHAVIVLRHWLGREPGQLKKLQTSLVESKKLTEVQARNLIHLLVGFNGEERADPDTYAVLLTYLDHPNQAVRTLANWHLIRLAPAGKVIAFDAGAPEEQRQQAVKRWHALIPDGQLPPVPKTQNPSPR